MKKLFSAVVISLVLSGCFSSVNLSNVNTPVTQSGEKVDYYSHLVGFGALVTNVRLCSSYYPKEKAKWMSLHKKISNFPKKAYTNEEITLINMGVLGGLMQPYMLEKNIPFTFDNVIKLKEQADKDKKLKSEIEKLSFKNSPKSTCPTIKQFEQKFKELANSTGKGHFL